MDAARELAPATRARLSLRQRSPRAVWRHGASSVMALVVALAAASSVAVLVAVLVHVIVQGLPALNLDFFTQRPSPFGETGGGVAPAIVGTLYMLAIAAIVGIPVGIGTGVYLSEFGRGNFAVAVRLAIDLIAGLPSIVVGVFVWALLVRQVVGQYSGLAGAVALAIIMVPIITRTVEEILKLVPDSLREASLALGVPRWRTIHGVVLPTAPAPVITRGVLFLARAGGETAPLLLTALGNQFFNLNLLEPMAALPVQIYTYAVAPYEDWHTKAWGSALVLVVVIGCLSLIARLATGRSRP